MVADQLAQGVRHQLGLGNLLPLGDAGDGAWLAESAAVAALRAAASQAVPEVRLDGLRLTQAAPDEAVAPAVPAPPTALPPGALRLEADFAAPADAPLTTVADRLRAALLTAADRRLGLDVAWADLRVTDLLDGPAGAAPGDSDRDAAPHGTAAATGPQPHGAHEAREAHEAEEHPPAPADHPRATATAETVIAVPGVTRLAPVLGPLLGGRTADAVSVTDVEEESGVRSRHLRIQIGVDRNARALDVARAVRQAAAKAAAWDAPEPAPSVTVAVVVTAIDPAIGSGGERTA
ncbi:nucleopolyhedrovirus P10 family protein [Streptomyces ovatisporus]|uniref:Nucleopolyhedrovirus P10 family protein n=1 Tax=Streptomyces ovatisporus TaxID=1128682 RepID=A0ABV9ABL0_9ACTN